MTGPWMAAGLRTSESDSTRREKGNQHAKQVEGDLDMLLIFVIIRGAFSIDMSPWNGYGNGMQAARSKRGARRAQVQQELFRHGGKRKGAGRKPRGPRAGGRHETRPVIKPYHALHVVMRVVAAVGNLRRRAMYKAVRDASVVAAVRERFRVVHLSIQGTHIHMLAEAKDAGALARGMQGFAISVARNVNTMLGEDRYRRRRGKVFADRYHVAVISSPRQARNALSYVLNNWRKHREDQTGLAATWLVDPFSSGISFPDWKEMEGRDLMWPIRDGYDPLLVRRPESWLLREGWKRAGTVSALEVPSQRRWIPARDAARS